jgi:hypothetical protein
MKKGWKIMRKRCEKDEKMMAQWLENGKIIENKRMMMLKMMKKYGKMMEKRWEIDGKVKGNR